MTEIIASVIAGMPYTIKVFVYAGLLLLYAYVVAWACDNHHNWIATFMIAIPLFLCAIFISYLFGLTA